MELYGVDQGMDSVDGCEYVWCRLNGKTWFEGGGSLSTILNKLDIASTIKFNFCFAFSKTIDD